MAQKISNLPVGAKVKDSLSKYNGKPVIWKIADKNHSGYPENTVTLISDKVLSIKSFNYNNKYKYSDLLKWLNKSDTNSNIYGNEPGFLYNFSSEFKNAIVSTGVKTNLENVTSKIFLISEAEAGNAPSDPEGTKLALFDGKESRKAYPTREAVMKNNYDAMLSEHSPCYWWTRTAASSDSVRLISEEGSFDWRIPTSGNGVRPLCNLKDEVLVSNTTDSDGSYTIEWNQPPTTPNDINVPSKVQAGKSLEITWGTSSDPEGNAVGYILERKVDTGSYSRIYKGINRSYSDTITKGWQNVTYRCKAYDNYGSESGYRTATQRTVNNNADPIISSSLNGNLGVKTGAFETSYQITDEDTDQTLTATEYLDGVEKRTFAATNGSTYKFKVTATEWQEILNGTHEIKIKAEDSEGGIGEKVFTFSKNETEILFALKTPLSSDDMVTKALLTIIGQIPSSATKKIELCNNGFDTSPTWEDVTSKVLKGSKIFLANESKTASKWGVNIRVSVKRNGASGECYIASTGGNFE